MAQHFLLSAAAPPRSPAQGGRRVDGRARSRAKVARVSVGGAEDVFARVRWPQPDGKPVCPRCGCQICYDCRRSEHQPRWRCKACRADFSVTSGTLFAWHKLPLRPSLMAFGVFCKKEKGKSMPAFCRDLDVQ